MFLSPFPIRCCGIDDKLGALHARIVPPVDESLLNRRGLAIAIQDIDSKLRSLGEKMVHVSRGVFLCPLPYYVVLKCGFEWRETGTSFNQYLNPLVDVL